jgi:hypothetical protein
VGVGGITQG